MLNLHKRDKRIAFCNGWQRHILPSMNVFVKYVRRIYTGNPSGFNLEWMMDKAMEEHEEETGLEFKFQHCIDTLVEIPRFDYKIFFGRRGRK